MKPLDVQRVKTAILATLALAACMAVACLIGCAAAAPFQPNANASNTATNSAQANPTTTVELPGRPAGLADTAPGKPTTQRAGG